MAAAGISVFVCSIAMLPSAMVIETPSASTRMLTTPLLTIVSLKPTLKPANERLLSAAIGDAADVWVKHILPRDRLYVTIQAAKAKSAVKDDTAKQNLAVFSAVMEAALSPSERANEFLRK
jgi:hypothetical protein